MCLEQIFESGHGRRALPPEDARVFARVEAQGQHETGVVALTARDRLEDTLVALRKTVPRIPYSKRRCPAGRPGGYRHAPRPPTEVTNLHRFMIARHTYETRSCSRSLVLLLPRRIVCRVQAAAQCCLFEPRAVARAWNRPHVLHHLPIP